MISQMDQVYYKAAITIMAAAGADAHTGLHGVSTFHRRVRQELHVHGAYLVELPCHGVDAIASTKWATRAWTFQEGCLSRRRLIFTQDQVLWLCNAAYAPEFLTQPISNRCLDGSNSQFSRFVLSATLSGLNLTIQNLCGLIEDYTRRQLSYDSDSLNAFLGVLNFYEVEDFALITHTWGVPIFHWDHSYDIFLLWRHTGFATRRPEFPSWSWAGWAGPILIGSSEGCVSSAEHQVSWDGIPFVCWLDEDSTISIPIEKFSARTVPTKARQSPHLGPRKLRISSWVVPVLIWTPETSHDQIDNSPLIAGYMLDKDMETGEIWNEENMAMLAVGNGSCSIAAKLDQRVEPSDHLLGICVRWKSEDHGTSFLVAKELDDGSYERVGAGLPTPEDLPPPRETPNANMTAGGFPMDGTKGSDTRGRIAYEWRTISLV